MLTKTVKVVNENGLHLRVAGKIVELIKNSCSKVSLNCQKCKKNADGCSILQMLLLEATKGHDLQIIVEGKDEKMILTKLEEIFTNGEGI